MSVIVKICISCLFVCWSRSDEIHTELCSNTIGKVKSEIRGLYNLTISAPNVTVSCINDSTLVGSRTVTCSNGKWVPPLPTCVVNCKRLPVKPFIISRNTAVAIWSDVENRTSGDTVTVKCVTSGYVVDGTDQVTCRDDRKWYPDPSKINCKERPPPPDRRLFTILAIACPSALVIVVIIIVIGKITFNIRQKSIERKETERLARKEHVSNAYRIWTVGRVHKKVVTAVDLHSLITKASKVFDKDYTKLVLEEDGTEVTTNSAMILCHDKVFMVLDRGDKWRPDAHETNEDIKLTFDVCSRDRSKRDLFLARGLTDLLSQVSSSFKEEAHCVCLEADGTNIDDNVSLNALAGQPLIALPEPEVWKADFSQRTQLLPKIPKQYTQQGQEICYKVWTANQKQKMMIFASDLVDLHIKVATAFGLHPPIEIKIFEDDTPIINNDQLKFHKSDVLVAKESRGQGPRRYSTATPSISSDYEQNSYAVLPDVLPDPYYNVRQPRYNIPRSTDHNMRKSRHNSTRETYF